MPWLPPEAAATPAGGTAGDGADQTIPWAAAASSGPGGPGAGPSRLPAFGGQVPQSPIGSQKVHGGDGPSAGDPAATSVQGSDGPDSKIEPGTVMVPAPATPEAENSVEAVSWVQTVDVPLSVMVPVAATRAGDAASARGRKNPLYRRDGGLRPGLVP